jgi:hypothetical protein
MDKPQRTRDQLRIAITTRLALSSACRDGIEVSVFPTDDRGGWNAVGSSNAQADCLRLLKIVVSALQAEFDLAPETRQADMERPRPPLKRARPHSPTVESFDEVAKKITQVALTLRENIAGQPSTPSPSSPETAPAQSEEPEHHSQESEHHRQEPEHHSQESEHHSQESEHHPQDAEHPPQEVQQHQEELQLVARPAVEKTPNVESIYPKEPSGALVAPNRITIDQGQAEFGEFNTKVDDLLTLLRESNEFSGEVRDQLIAEILAGRALLGAPKADPILLEQFLANPLKYIAKKSSQTPIGTLTVAMLMLLGKLTSRW